MHVRVLILAVFAALLGVAPLFIFAGPAETAEIPPGFEDRLETQVLQPTSMAFLPDGRMLVTTQPGFLQLYDPATGEKRTALDLRDRICSESERGLLGVAVDPKFESNRYVYLYYTFKRFDPCLQGRPTSKRNPVNRVARYTLPEGGNATGEKVLIDNIPSPQGNHNGGDLHFGKDGYLYVSVGDGGRDYKNDSGGGGENNASRDRNVLLGKILRVTRDGAIPETNPYVGPDSGRCNVTGKTAAGNDCQETFARGLRNPFRMAFDPDAEGTRFNINDVGQNAWEEIDYGRKGADYGWNVCEGRHDNPDRPGSVTCNSSKPFTPPIHEYSHSSGCSSVTGGAFVPDGAWPAEYDNSYLFGDYVCGRIFSLTPKSGGGYERTPFATGLGRGGPVAMTFGPSGEDLYYTTYAGGDGGQIRRISYTAGAGAPKAVARANPPHAESRGDLTIAFDGTGSTDPNGDRLTYEWDFDYDGTNFQADPLATGPTASHTYAAAGKKTAALRVTDTDNLSTIARVKVYPGDTLPRPVIESPATDARFGVGQQITLRGSATDAESPDAPVLTWQVIRHHNNSHTHPYKSGEGESLAITGPEPEDLFATNPNGNYLEVRLRATQENGLSKTVSRRLEPRTVNVAFRTNPAGLRLVLNGRRFSAPRTFLSWEGSRLNVNAPQQRRDGKTYVFDSWSDGRAARHTIISPSSYRKYTATFRKQ